MVSNRLRKLRALSVFLSSLDEELPIPTTAAALSSYNIMDDIILMSCVICVHGCVEWHRTASACTVLYVGRILEARLEMGQRDVG